jgi:thiol-disulfide isomerase/thioredoxin
MPQRVKPSVVTLALSLAAIVVYIGYRAVISGSADDSSSARVELDAAGAPQLPDTLPSVVLDDLDGTPTPLSSWAGKPLVINFWATWCAPCLREIPLLKSFQQSHPDVQVVGIAIDQLEPVVAFAADMGFNYPVLVGPEAMAAAGAFGVDFVALPFTVFASAAGAVIGVHTGELHTEHLENLSAVFDDLGSARIDEAAARKRLTGRR